MKTEQRELWNTITDCSLRVNHVPIEINWKSSARNHKMVSLWRWLLLCCLRKGSDWSTRLPEPCTPAIPTDDLVWFTCKGNFYEWYRYQETHEKYSVSQSVFANFLFNNKSTLQISLHDSNHGASFSTLIYLRRSTIKSRFPYWLTWVRITHRTVINIRKGPC